MSHAQKLLKDLFQAYYDARKNKRNTINQLKFEFHLEENIMKLYDEIQSGEYEVGESVYFIQDYPVKREIFAGSFRDRVVHHFIYNIISPIFKKQFIYDSYSCRKGKGTLFGIQRLKKAIRSCSQNYTKDSYILKLDISGYFMNINKQILFHKLQKTLVKKKEELCYDYDFVIDLLQKIIQNDCTKNSIFKGKRQDYIGLPKNKSLFFAEQNCGLPIGNLTSQLFSNIYLTDLDYFIKDTLQIKHYGRYVDDFYLVAENKEYLKTLVPKINTYLQNNLGLILHPKKIYLQHYTKGVLFLGAFIKPHRSYVNKRVCGSLYTKIQILNKRLKQQENKADEELKNEFLTTINSYLGYMKQHTSYKQRKKLLLNHVSAYFRNYFYISGGYRLIKRK